MLMRLKIHVGHIGFIFVAAILIQGCGRVETKKPIRTIADKKGLTTSVGGGPSIANPTVAPAGSPESNLVGTYKYTMTKCLEIEDGKEKETDEKYLAQELNGDGNVRIATLSITSRLFESIYFQEFGCYSTIYYDFKSVNDKEFVVVGTELVISGDDGKTEQTCRSSLPPDALRFGKDERRFRYKIEGNELLIISGPGGLCSKQRLDEDHYAKY